ncbi:MAG: hypothetical protein ACK4ND_16320 [Cytophagaceae bacterium]
MDSNFSVVGILSSLFKVKEEHAVIIYFQYGLESLDPLHELEGELRNLLNEHKVGRLDGHEVEWFNVDGFLYLYGENAETLFKCIKPTLEACPFMRGAEVQLYFGPGRGENERQLTITLGG